MDECARRARRTIRFMGRVLFRRRVRSGLPLVEDADFQALIAFLNSHGVSYVALGRVDDSGGRTAASCRILVADEDVPKLRSSARPGGRRFKIVSVSGLPGYDYRNMAYLPPDFARTLIDRSEPNASGWRVPGLEQRFWTRAYEMVYHKGFDSGLAERVEKSPSSCSSGYYDYVYLRDLRSRLGINVTLTLRHLHRELVSRRISPSMDALIRLGVKNRFCDLLVEEFLSTLPEARGLACFVVREKGAEPEIFREVEQMIAADGFHVLDVWWLNEQEREWAREIIRGGNWGCGILPLSGGPPRVFVFAQDPSPLKVNRKVRMALPRADNARVLETKERIRKWYTGLAGPGRECNILHSTDFARQAVFYATLARPPCVAGLVAKSGVGRCGAGEIPERSGHGQVGVESQGF
jgi:hypothetical protein